MPCLLALVRGPPASLRCAALLLPARPVLLQGASVDVDILGKRGAQTRPHTTPRSLIEALAPACYVPRPSDSLPLMLNVRRTGRFFFVKTCSGGSGGNSFQWPLRPIGASANHSQLRFASSLDKNKQRLHEEGAEHDGKAAAPRFPEQSPLITTAANGSRRSSSPTPAQPPPSTGPPRLIRHPPAHPTQEHHLAPPLRDSFYPAPHYYTPPSPLGASVLIARNRAARRNRSRFDNLPLFQFRSSLAEVDFDSPSGWSAHNSIGWQVQRQAERIRQQQQQQQNDPSSSTMSSASASSNAKTSALAGQGADTMTKRSGAHEHEQSQAAGHSHSHGLLGHSHDHSHAHGSPEEADRLIEALKGKGDRGSNITLLGLFSNIVLCISKGLAGMWLNSASLVADAAHSLSDMFSDLVTLFCWKMSQKPPSQTHPLGYGKYETMGGLGVSVVLVGGSVGIGLHSWSLLLEALQPMIETAPVLLQQVSHWTGSIASMGPGGHSHHDLTGGHGAETGVLDPNAMWFALLSVAVKEWLYYATMKIAKEENSSVLEANALHHRSDSLSSGVTFVAIGGSWLGLPILDPLGGLLVAALIGKQGFDLLISALRELSDRGVDLDVLEDFKSAMNTLQSTNDLLLGWKNLRAVKSGVSTFVDITLVMDGSVTLSQARQVEDQVRDTLVECHKGVKEVRVHMAPSGSE